MIKLVVFDFDGTIADSKKEIYSSFIEVLKKYGHSVDYNSMKYHLGLVPLQETLKTFGVKNISKVAEEIVKQILKKTDSVKPVVSLEPLRTLDKKKIILSNNTTKYIQNVLKNWDEDLFDEVYGADKFNSKKEMFSKFIRKYKIQPREIVYVGDRVNDVQLAQSVGCISVSISGEAAWSDYEDIKTAEPDFIIKDWRGLIRVIKELDV